MSPCLWFQEVGLAQTRPSRCVLRQTCISHFAIAVRARAAGANEVGFPDTGFDPDLYFPKLCGFVDLGCDTGVGKTLIHHTKEFKSFTKAAVHDSTTAHANADTSMPTISTILSICYSPHVRCLPTRMLPLISLQCNH